MKHSITLTSDERHTLLDYLRRAPSPDLRLRAHIILLLADGHTWATLTTVLYCSSRTVARWKKRFQHGRLRPLRLRIRWRNHGHRVRCGGRSRRRERHLVRWLHCPADPGGVGRPTGHRVRTHRIRHRTGNRVLRSPVDGGGRHVGWMTEQQLSQLATRQAVPPRHTATPSATTMHPNLLPEPTSAPGTATSGAPRSPSPSCRALVP